MRMEGQDESQNVEDARGSSGFRPVHGIGLGTIALALIGGWIFGVNPLQLLGLMSGGGTTASTAPTSMAPDQSAAAPPAGDAQAHFVSQILRSTEQVWTDVFRQRGATYEEPKLVLFRGSYPTACGQGEAAAGPFYCSRDRRVYIDLAFFDQMSRQLHAPGQFAQAYVVGHEVGHHVQNLLGILDRVDRGTRASIGSTGQCAQRAARAAGGLPGGRLGDPVAAGARLAARAGRHTDGAECGLADRRRHPAAALSRGHRSRVFHTWHRRAAGELVSARRRFGKDRGMRHVRGDDAVARRRRTPGE